MNPSANDYQGQEATGDALSINSLTQDDWVNLGAGAALVALGTGRVTLGGLVRLAALAAGGTMLYRGMKQSGLLSRIQSAMPVGQGSASEGGQEMEVGSTDSTASSFGGSPSGSQSGSAGLSGGLNTGRSGSLASGATLGNMSQDVDPLRARGEQAGDDTEKTGLAGADGIPAVDLRGA